MRTCTRCPACNEMLTLVATPPTLACPFCRSTIPTSGGNIPVGKKVRCAKCRGVFTAESPPTVIRLYLATIEPCPFCDAPLAIRHGRPPGKKVRCCQCRKVFRPRGKAVPAHEAPPEAEVPASDPALNLPPPPQKPVSKTRLGPRSHTGRSSITHLATEPLPETSADVDIFQLATPSPTRDDDEIDLFGPERGTDGKNGAESSVHAAPVHSNGTPPVAADSALPAQLPPSAQEPHYEAAPSPESPPPEPIVLAKRNQSRSPKPGRAKKKRRLAPTPAAEPMPTPDVTLDDRPPLETDEPMPTPDVTLDDRPPLETEDPAEAAGSNGEAEQAELPKTRKLVLSRKEPIVAEPTPTPEIAVEEDREALETENRVETAGSDGEAQQAEVNLSEPSSSRNAALSIEIEAPPLSSRSLELAAANAMLADYDAEDVSVEDDSSDHEVATAPAPPPSIPKPTPAQAPKYPQPAPTYPRTSAGYPRTSAGSAGLSFDTRKLRTYGVPVVVVLLLVGGMYYFISARSRPRVYPVEGHVLFEGKPPVGARVTLFPDSKRDRYRPAGKVDQDGNFKLTTYGQDGAPVGRYKVAITRLLEMEEYNELSKTLTPEEVARKSEEMNLDPLNERYGTAKTSGLIAEITAKPTRLEYKLGEDR